jgi:hypothetical protein
LLILPTDHLRCRIYNSTALSDGLDQCLGLLASMDANEKPAPGKPRSRYVGGLSGLKARPTGVGLEACLHPNPQMRDRGHTAHPDFLTRLVGDLSDTSKLLRRKTRPVEKSLSGGGYTLRFILNR